MGACYYPIFGHLSPQCCECPFNINEWLTVGINNFGHIIDLKFEGFHKIRMKQTLVQLMLSFCVFTCVCWLFFIYIIYELYSFQCLCTAVKPELLCQLLYILWFLSFGDIMNIKPYCETDWHGVGSVLFKDSEGTKENIEKYQPYPFEICKSSQSQIRLHMICLQYVKQNLKNTQWISFGLMLSWVYAFLLPVVNLYRSWNAWSTLTC